jgi:hypothetical protein
LQTLSWKEGTISWILKRSWRTNNMIKSGRSIVDF